MSESVLPFNLRPLPGTINNDMEITITSSGGLNVTKYKRLMRAPVPTSDVGAVQVDHSTRGLRINGKAWNANGFFLWSDFMNLTNLRNFSNHMPRLVEDGMNVLFMYGLNGVVRPLWNSSYDLQLEFLDNCSAAGMKVIYPPDWGAMNPMGGHGTKGNCAMSPMACANESLVEDLKGNLTKVMGHPAILGFYVCDDCCDDQPDISAMAQIFNIIKSIDPYHLIAGAVNCHDVWMFNEVASIGLPPTNLLSSLQRGAVIPWGVQPRNQLSLDLPMVENYGGEPFSQYSNMNPGAVSRDGDLRHGNSFSVVVNMEAPEAYVNFTGLSGDHKPSTLRGEQAAVAKAWLGAITANIISTIDWSLNVWGVNPWNDGESPLVIPGTRFGAQTRALLHILQAPFGSVSQPSIAVEAQSWHGLDDDVNPGAIKARAWRSNETDLCVVVAMVNTMDCSPTPMPPRPNCKTNSTYTGYVDFRATLLGLPTTGDATMKRVFAYLLRTICIIQILSICPDF